MLLDGFISKFTGNLRVCADVKEIEFEIGQSEEEEFEFKGNQWYSFYDRHVGQTLKVNWIFVVKLFFNLFCHLLAQLERASQIE